METYVMITANIVAHFVGDFIFQPNSLAYWKSRSPVGVLVHCLIVLLITALFTLTVELSWWPWLLFVGVMHTAVDMSQFWLKHWLHWDDRGSTALARFAVDQALHLGTIIVALIGSGYLPAADPFGALIVALQNTELLTLLLGYSFILMPAWVIVKFLVYGLVVNMPPEFTGGADKYSGMAERLLITTFVLLGQYLLIPLVTLPRLLLESRHRNGSSQKTIFVAELLTSVFLAVATGVSLKLLIA